MMLLSLVMLLSLLLLLSSPPLLSSSLPPPLSTLPPQKKTSRIVFPTCLLPALASPLGFRPVFWQPRTVVPSGAFSESTQACAALYLAIDVSDGVCRMIVCGNQRGFYIFEKVGGGWARRGKRGEDEDGKDEGKDEEGKERRGKRGVPIIISFILLEIISLLYIRSNLLLSSPPPIPSLPLPAHPHPLPLLFPLLLSFPLISPIIPAH